MSERRAALCPRCGASTYDRIDDHRSRCSECGLGRTSQPLILGGTRSATSPVTATQEPAPMPDIAGHMQRAFVDASFSPYGLDDRWQDTRWLGGTGSSDNEITRLELAHGENPWDDEATQVRVQTLFPRTVSPDDATNIAIEFDSLTRQQLNRFWMATGTLP